VLKGAKIMVEMREVGLANDDADVKNNPSE
jgi:hypothetical protein